MTKRDRPAASRNETHRSAWGRAESIVAAVPGSALPRDWQGLFVVAASALLFARMVTATEGAVLGETLWIALLWLLLAAGWLITPAGSGRRLLREPLTWFLGLIVLGHAASTCMIFLVGGERRGALNLLFEWFSLLASWVVLRGVFATRRLQARLASGLISLALGLALLGIWQHFVWYPRMAREYAAVRTALDEKQVGKETKATSATGRAETVESLQRKLAGMGAPLDGPSRTLWENRLSDSSEPFGMFALANTFAGLLAFWLVLLLGVRRRLTSPIAHEVPVVIGSQTPAGSTLGVERGSGRGLAFFLGWPSLMLAICGPISVCLVLTKSRTAWVATAAGISLWGLIEIGKWVGGTWRVRRKERFSAAPTTSSRESGRESGEVSSATPLEDPANVDPLSSHRRVESDSPFSSPRFRWPMFLLGGTFLFVLCVAAWWGTRRWDAEVISEAPKSLTYRLQYWDGTLSMLQDRWLFGAGPGNFRPNYLGHKRAESSEEIADPHNWLLDLWSSGGLLALAGGLGLFLWILLFVGRVLFRSQVESKPTPVESPFREPSGRPIGEQMVLIGGLLGLLICLAGPWILGADGDGRLLALAVVCLAYAGWEHRVTKAGREPTSPHSLSTDATAQVGFESRRWQVAGATASLTLLVHLLGAGGIEMPAVVQLLLVGCLLIAGTNREAAGVSLEAARPASVRGMRLSAGAFGLLAVACLVWGVWPVWRRQVLSDTGTAAWVNRGDVELALKHFQAAADVDPFSAEPWEKISELNFARWKQSPLSLGADEWFAQAVAAQRRAIEQNPADPHGYRRLGEKYLARVEQFDRFAGGAFSERVRQRRDEMSQRAVEAFAEAGRRYPNSSLIESLWSMAELRNGAQSPARAHATRALELDDINRQAGHVDKYLPTSVRNEMQRLAQ